MRKLVIIDDDPVDHFIMKHMLYGKNYFDTTTFTAEGPLVLEYLKFYQDEPEKLPDVIFLDLNMPVYNGWDFLNEMKELEPSLSKDIKIYVITSSVRTMDVEQVNKYPFVSSFISKPIQPYIIEQIAKKQPIFSKVSLQ